MKRTSILLAKVLVSVGLLAYLLSTTDLSLLHDRFLASNAILLVAGASLYVGMLALSTWRWHLLLRAQGFAPTLRDLSASYLVATFFNNFLPSNIGGDLIRVRDSSRLTGSTTASLAVVAVDRILGFGALYLLAAGAFVLGAPSLRRLAGAREVVLGLGLFFAALAYVFFRPGTARRFMAASGLASLPWVQERFEIVQSAVHVYREQLGAVFTAFGASVALQALLVCYYYSVARALHIPLPLAASFVMVPLCTLLQSVPISFNGWGIRESVFIVYFAQIGLPRESALAFSLLGAGLTVLLSLAGAVVWTSRGRSPQPLPPAGVV